MAYRYISKLHYPVGTSTKYTSL